MATLATGVIEHVEIGGLPLATPAWRVVDAGDLYSPSPARTALVDVPWRDGALPRRMMIGPKAVTLPMVILGRADSDGVPAAGTALEQLRANVDELARELYRGRHQGDGTLTLRHHLAGGQVRAGPCQVSRLAVGHAGPSDLHATLDLLIPAGVLRDEVETVVAEGSNSSAIRTVTVGNAGTAHQDALEIEFVSGTATAVEIRNLTWDPAGGTWVKLDPVGSQTAAGRTLWVGDWQVTGGDPADVVTHAGHERWLPLLPGDNQLEIRPTGGTTRVTFRHYPAYL